MSTPVNANELKIYSEIATERQRQNKLWGVQDHPNYTDPDANEFYRFMADSHKKANDENVRDDTLDWCGILLEEVYEALSESDPEKLKTELIQSCAVIVAWVDAIDRQDNK